MQSGISVSKELHDAFKRLLSAGKNVRGLIASIRSEEIVLSDEIPSDSYDFFDDLARLDSLIRPNEAAYIILRRYSAVPDGFVAVSFIPDAANVRQKMLFASTRQTLVRELGLERFRETWFATTKSELTPDGWRRHEQHNDLKAPLTDEEQALQGFRDAEAETSQGASAKSSYVGNGLTLPVSTEALQALRRVQGAPENLVQLMVDTTRETIELASATAAGADEMAVLISNSEPRFTFFRYQHEHEANIQSSIVFVYTCPTASVKERMLYASSKAGIIETAARDADLILAKKLEVSMPSEISANMLHEEFYPKTERKTGFARPKRPGRTAT